MKISEKQENELIKDWCESLIRHHKEITRIGRMIMGTCEVSALPCTGLSTREDVYYPAIDVSDVFKIGRALDLPVFVSKYPVDNLNVCTVLKDGYLFREIMSDSEFADADKYSVTISMNIYKED